MVGGAELTVLVPQDAVRFDVVEVFQQSDRLFMILKDLDTQGWEDNLGIIAVATRQSDDCYAVVVWHSTYPYLWRYL